MAYYPPKTVKVPGRILEWQSPCRHHEGCGYWLVELEVDTVWVSTYHQPDLDLVDQAAE